MFAAIDDVCTYVCMPCRHAQAPLTVTVRAKKIMWSDVWAMPSAQEMAGVQAVAAAENQTDELVP